MSRNEYSADTIVDSIAYAQAHGLRAVLDQAIQTGGDLPADVVDLLIEARQAAAQAEVAAKALQTAVRKPVVVR